MAETETPGLTVDEAMIKVMQEIGPVGKNGRNKTQNYEFQAHDDIVTAAQEPMARYGLRMLPEVIDQKHFVRGERTNVAILTVRYVMRGPRGDVMDTPIVVVGEGADVADKASNKAMTAAEKYAFKQAFKISDGGADDGDRDHPVATPHPLAWYDGQIRQEKVWCNAHTLRGLLNKAEAERVADLPMPNNSAYTFRQIVEGRGRALVHEREQQEQRRTQERAAAQAQMAAEYPDPPDPYEDVWAAPAAPQPTPHPPAPTPVPAPQWQTPAPAAEPQWETPAPAVESQWSTPVPAAEPQWSNPVPDWGAEPESAPELPDATTVERQLADALADPTNAEQRLHALRARYGVAPLAQTVVRTEWGSVDANSAITMGLMNRMATGKPAAQPAPSSPPPAPAPEPKPEPSAESVPSDEPALPEPQLAEIHANMSAEERGKAHMIAEVEFQAQMLGVPTLELVADLLPEGGSSVEDIKGAVRLQSLIRETRPQVLKTLERRLPQVAEAYAKLGNRVPARNINDILTSVLQVR